MAEFRVDAEQLDAVRRMLELELPLRVWVGKIKRYVARYVTDAGGVHRIALSNELTVEQAEHALLHEIQHAAQVERFGSYDAFVLAWWAEMEAMGITPEMLEAAASPEDHPDEYTQTGLELEADEFADSFPCAAGLVLPAG